MKLNLLQLASVVILLQRMYTQDIDVKRADDPIPLQTIVMQQADTISQLQARLDSMETEMASMKAQTDAEIASLKSLLGTQAACHVRFTGSVPRNFTGDSILTFDLLALNQGDVYDKVTGMFTAPVAGLYVFSLKIAHTPPGYLHVLIMKEGHEIAEVEASGDDASRPDRSSATVAVHLQAGQRVWVQRHDGMSTVTAVQVGWRSTFTGFLVRAD